MAGRGAGIEGGGLQRSASTQSGKAKSQHAKHEPHARPQVSLSSDDTSARRTCHGTTSSGPFVLRGSYLFLAHLAKWILSGGDSVIILDNNHFLLSSNVSGRFHHLGRAVRRLIAVRPVAVRVA